MLWHEKTWPQLAELDKKIPVLIPLGACEQHGRHLPLHVDTIQVGSIARYVEEAISSDLLLLPEIWVGSSHEHLYFPGTLSLPASLYSAVIKSIGMSVINAGFKRVLFLNGHGGNTAPASSAIYELMQETKLDDDGYIVFATWWDLAQVSKNADKHGIEPSGFEHACECETSCMMHLRPDLVFQDEIMGTGKNTPEPWKSESASGPIKVFCQISRRTVSGAFGHPEKASAKKGESIITDAVASVIEFLKNFRNWPSMPKCKQTDS